MIWSEAEVIDQEHRNSMRYYLALLEEYNDLLRSKSDPDALAATEQKLDEKKTALFQAQEKRENNLDARLGGIYLDLPISSQLRDGRIKARLLGLFQAYRHDLAGVANGCGVYKFDAPLIEERQSLQRMIARLEAELRSRQLEIPVDPTPPRNPAEKVTAAWQAKKNAVLRLEHERDEELRISPESMHKTIKRVYGKAIDAIMEEE